MLRIIQEKFRTQQQKMAQCAGSFRMQIRLSFNSFCFSLPLLSFSLQPFLSCIIPFLSFLPFLFLIHFLSLLPFLPSTPLTILPCLSSSTSAASSSFSYSILFLFLIYFLSLPASLSPPSPPHPLPSLTFLPSFKLISLPLPSFSGFSMAFLPYLSIIFSTVLFPLPFLLSFACFSRYPSHFIFSIFLVTPPL